MADNRYCIDYARLGTAGCKKCKVKIDKGSLRIAKVVSNPFSDEGGDMKHWHHVNCIFETFKRARATTKKIEGADDLEGWDNIKKEDQKMVLDIIKEFEAGKNPDKGKKTTNVTAKKRSPQKQVAASTSTPLKQAKLPFSSPKKSPSPSPGPSPSPAKGKINEKSVDNSLREFRKLCANIAEEPSYNAKTNIVSKFLADGSSGDGFEGDLYLWIKILLPGIAKRVYNVQSKQLVKLFSQIFGTYLEEMVEDLEQGDVAETIKTFYEKSTTCPPIKKSTLTLYEVDEFLDELTKVTKEDDQMRVLKRITKRCTSNDLKMVIRLIKHDLRINAGAKHVLDAIHPDAYQAFQTSRNLKDVIEMVSEQKNESGGGKGSPHKPLKIRASLMTPVLPMLAEACKSVEQAMKKCPNGMFAEIKYDGERVQVHKKGSTFTYFSRSLKPVLPHKVQHFKDYIPKAFPNANDLILDSEVLLVDTNTGNPLPFGTLGKHKKTAFKDATVCLFIFDCIHYNDDSLMHKPLKERKEMLSKVMQEIPNHIMFSEMKHIKKSADLQDMINSVLKKGLEGLVLKDCLSVYEPGKRHWLKVKKDYLNQGALADTADLVVLGAFFGTGNKGGIKSIFLMGCYDPNRNKWCTVTKVHGGHDDKTLDRLQTELKMVKISKDPSKVPKWLDVNKNMTPDFVTEDPKKSQVWEITGAEFSKAEVHTASGISIRFPRVTRIRYDKDWKTATNLDELKVLFENSKHSSDASSSSSGNLTKTDDEDDGDDEYGGDTEIEEDSNNSDEEKTPKKGKSEKGKNLSQKKKDSDGEYGGDTDVDDMSISDEDKTPMKGKLSKLSKTGRKKHDYENDVESMIVLDEERPEKKRKRSSDDSDESPNKKTKGGQSKPTCKYGASCYQNNKSHREKFGHPPKTTAVKHPTKNPLPDVFTDISIYLPKDEKDYDELSRYIIAYDGDIVDELSLQNATHIVTSDKKKIKKYEGKFKDAEVVTIGWLEACIKSKEIKPTAQYLHT